MTKLAMNAIKNISDLFGTLLGKALAFLLLLVVSNIALAVPTNHLVANIYSSSVATGGVTPVVGSWQNYSYSFQAPASATTIAILQRNDCGVFLIDDVSVKDGSNTELISNGNFSGGVLPTTTINNDGIPTSWTKGGLTGWSGSVSVTDYIETDFTTGASGAYGAQGSPTKFQLSLSTSPYFAGVLQTIPTIANANYTLAFRLVYFDTTGYLCTPGSLGDNNASALDSSETNNITQLLVYAGDPPPGYVGPPSALTSAATSITSSGATLNASASDNGAATTVTFEYGTSSGSYSTTGVTPDSNGSISAGAGTKSIAKALAGLSASTTYYYRVKATSTQGSVYGAEKSFTTTAPSYAVTYNGNGNTGGTAPTDGSSPYSGGSTVTVLGNTGSLTKTGFNFIGWNTVADGSGTARAASSTFSIAANTTLYAQWAAAPSATTNAASSVASTTATLNGSVDDKGASTTITFEYGTSSGAGGSYTNLGIAPTSNGTLAAGSGATAVSNGVTGLSSNTTYYYRVKGVNSQGTTYGSEQSFTTSKQAQTITFTNPGAKNFGTTPTLTASSDSNLTVTFTSGTTSVCTITSGGALTFVTTGSCTINADQAGNGSFLAASTVSHPFTVNAVAPGAPAIGTASAGDTQATVSFTAPAFDGGATITGYTVTSNPGGFTSSGCTASPCTVTGLTNGVAYTFTVTATNSAPLTSLASSASNSVTPNPGPAVVSVAVPANGTYGLGQNLDFTITWDSNITVTGTPQLAITFNTGGTVQAGYVSSPTATTMLFRHTIAAGKNDPDGITIGALTLNGGTIQNGVGTNATLTLNSVAATSNVLVDTTAPTLPAANIVVNNQADPHKVVLTFSENLDATSLGAAGAWTLTANGGSPSYAVANVALSSGKIVTLTLNAIDVANSATTITNAAAVGHLKITPPATLKDLAGNAYAAGLVTESGATHVLDTTPPTLTAVATSAPTTSGAKLDATANEKAMGYWIAVAAGSAAPSVAQAQAAANYGAVTVVAHGSGALISGGASSLTLNGLAASTAYDVYLVAQDAAGNLSGSVASAALTTATPPPPPATNPTTTLTTQPAFRGVINQPTVLDANASSVQAIVNCAVDALRQTLGGNLIYLGQTPSGATQISWNGQMISFYPLSASTTDTRAGGIHTQSVNPADVVGSCGSLNVTPAANSLAELGSTLADLGLSAQINQQGVITVDDHGTIYVVRPDFVVTTGDNSHRGLYVGEDGLFRFTDSAGNTQIMRPAFLDPGAVQNVLTSAFNATMSVQLDGTVLVRQGATLYVLTANQTLTGIAQDHASDSWWMDGTPARYFYRVVATPYTQYGQGLSQPPQPQPQPQPQ